MELIFWKKYALGVLIRSNDANLSPKITKMSRKHKILNINNQDREIGIGGYLKWFN